MLLRALGSISRELEIRPVWRVKKLDYLPFIFNRAWLRAVLGDLISWHSQPVLNLGWEKATWQGVAEEYCWHQLHQCVWTGYGDACWSMSYNQNNNYWQSSGPGMWFSKLKNLIYLSNEMSLEIWNHRPYYILLGRSREGRQQVPFCTQGCIYLSPHHCNPIFPLHIISTVCK